jgi:prepilin-type N-terminal cleavage/methylation domain-containing protein
MSTKLAYKRCGVSLVEVLIVVAIIAILIQLALPAIESSREAARQASCQNNLRQIGLAMLNHESTLKCLPTAGWGWAWIGDPDRGTAEDQPGSWAYQLLPYMEQQNVYDIGRGTKSDSKYEALARLAGTPVSLLYCPSRRLPRATPNTFGPVDHPDFIRGDLFWYNAKEAEKLARMDYAANLGDEWLMWFEGPPPDKADAGEGFGKFLAIDGQTELSFDDANGVVVQRHPFELQEITDGVSKTYFGGEKMMFASHYKTGTGLNDDQSCWNGDDLDTVCSTAFWPQRDRPKEFGGLGAPFGGPHPAGFNMVYCDGSIKLVNFDIDPQVHRVIGVRDDNDVPKDPVPPPPSGP